MGNYQTYQTYSTSRKPKVNFSVISFLSEGQQEIYEDAIKKYSGKARDCLEIPIKGSSLFKVVLLNELGITTATMSQLESAREKRMPLKEYYVDTPSVVLRSNGDFYEPNDYLAKYLFKEVKERNEKLETLKHPLVLTGLKLKEDSNSFYGLIVEPNENFEFFEASELDHENNGRKFLRLDKRGIPIFDEKGSRILHTRENGLSRLYLAGKDLFSEGDLLAHSEIHGRVVVVKINKTSPQKF